MGAYPYQVRIREDDVLNDIANELAGKDFDNDFRADMSQEEKNEFRRQTKEYLELSCQSLNDYVYEWREEQLSSSLFIEAGFNELSQDYDLDDFQAVIDCLISHGVEPTYVPKLFRSIGTDLTFELNHRGGDALIGIANSRLEASWDVEARDFKDICIAEILDFIYENRGCTTCCSEQHLIVCECYNNDG